MAAVVSSPKTKYPTNAPTATANMTEPLYVMKRSLDGQHWVEKPTKDKTHMMKKL